MAEMSKAPRVVKRCSVSHEEGSRATRCPNGAHEDEDAAAREAGVLGHRVARLKGAQEVLALSRQRRVATASESEGHERGQRGWIIAKRQADRRSYGSRFECRVCRRSSLRPVSKTKSI